jgi:hypothetical protein
MLGRAKSGGKEPLLRVVSPGIVDLTGDKLLPRSSFLLERPVREDLGDDAKTTSDCSVILAKAVMMKLSFSSAVRALRFRMRTHQLVQQLTMPPVSQ